MQGAVYIGLACVLCRVLIVCAAAQAGPRSWRRKFNRVGEAAFVGSLCGRSSLLRSLFCE